LVGDGGPDGSRVIARSGEQPSPPRSPSPRRHLLHAAIGRCQPMPSCSLLDPVPPTLSSIQHLAIPTYPSPNCISTLQICSKVTSNPPPPALAQLLEATTLAAHTPALLNLLLRVWHPDTPPTIEPRHPTHQQEATQPHSPTLSYVLD
jgi:hypothetical protein